MADTIGIKVTSRGTFLANCINELGTKWVGININRGGRVNHTSSVIDFISEITRSAHSSLSVPFSALVTDGCADSIGIEEEFGGAGSADLILETATSIEGGCGGIDNTASTVGVNKKSIIAFFTDSNISIEDLTISIYFATDSILVEDVAG